MSAVLSKKNFRPSQPPIPSLPGGFSQATLGPTPKRTGCWLMLAEMSRSRTSGLSFRRASCPRLKYGFSLLVSAARRQCLRVFLRTQSAQEFPLVGRPGGRGSRRCRSFHAALVCLSALRWFLNGWRCVRRMLWLHPALRLACRARQSPLQEPNSSALAAERIFSSAAPHAMSVMSPPAGRLSLRMSWLLPSRARRSISPARLMASRCPCRSRAGLPLPTTLPLVEAQGANGSLEMSLPPAGSQAPLNWMAMPRSAGPEPMPGLA